MNVIENFVKWLDGGALLYLLKKTENLTNARLFHTFNVSVVDHTYIQECLANIFCMILLKSSV